MFDLNYLVDHQNDDPTDLTIPCPCECGRRLAPKLEAVDGKWVLQPFTKANLEEFVRRFLAVPHPKLESPPRNADKARV